VIVAPVNDRHPARRASESPCRRNTAETAPDNHHMRQRLVDGRLRPRDAAERLLDQPVERKRSWTPKDARTLLEDGSRRIDIVLAEVKSGDASGFALASWVRTHLPNTQVVLAGTIATATEKAGDICQEGPALSKPYDHRLVLDHIQQLLAARDRNDRN
jgi:DNA-binding NtrC family response regulator